ncbi:MAG: hypothetical protein A2571_03580 [Candidatus Vogelbacteria bacterium RIFOXYD1_FULL_44_32]|uniref:Lipopolysaccharide assembly protein A domain-containing protein n=1 Tax=Candidatus Vogelbacteria bacterium RIFOXYD1_FULL_44_32 TaxID=1802438 RepID=A0A1G2QBZ6_9BACT|nr:MAG: hypothetical protein A2571_03580 [Candidatus Vogelbacteria bacterium RIFOXYD1_FULL_44_32]
MIISLILGLLVGAGAVVFALQNTFAVTVTFLAWEITAPLAVLIILSLIVGILISILMTIPGDIQNAFTIYKLKKDNRKLNEQATTATKTESEATPNSTDIPSKNTN